MPQPLSSIPGNLGFVLASGNTPHNAEMASAVLAVINLWSQIDYNYGVLVARIARADPVTVTAVFQTMISTEARQAALFSAAKEKLTPEQASLIMAVIDTFKTSKNTRNAFAHHLWGSLNTRPDCVVLAHPKTIARYTAQMTAWSGNGPVPDFDRSEFMVWRQPDFDEAVAAARTAHGRAVELSFTFDHGAADRHRGPLLADPQIQHRYNVRLAENAP